MSAPKNEMYYSLLEWFKTLNLNAPHADAESLADGVALAQALNQFAPESFTDAWLSKIKASAVGSNWRLRMSNLKKVTQSVYDYYSEVLNLSLSDFSKPDLQRIAEKCDLGELERLLQLVLGCAVNCAKKQSYITEIMCLEEELQANIMRALQELETTRQASSPEGGVVSSLSRSSLSGILDTKAVQEERDAMAQKCFETEKKMLLLIDEKTNLQQELQKLQQEFARLEQHSTVIGDDGVSLGAPSTVPRSSPTSLRSCVWRRSCRRTSCALFRSWRPQGKPPRRRAAWSALCRAAPSAEFWTPRPCRRSATPWPRNALRPRRKCCC